MNKFTNITFKGQTIMVRRSSGSHIPVLRAIARYMPVRRVIEEGTGIFSLKTFLDRNYFKDMEQIISFETNKFWIDYMTSMFSDDRWNIVLTKSIEEMENDMVKFAPADILFVDGTYENRLHVLNNVKDVGNIIVLHDCDLPQFELILNNGFKYKYVYVPPEFRHTAILSDKIDVSSIDWNIEWDNSFMEWI